MKRFTIGLLILLFICSPKLGIGQSNQNTDVKDEDTFRKVDNKAFQAGELLEYKFAYGIMNAGNATLEVKKTSQAIKGRELLHVVGKGKSISAFDWFFKVRDRYETYLDKDGIFPWLFIRRINEGGYKKAQDYQFFQDKGYVKNQKQETYKVPHGIQDMLSSFYYARTIDFSNAKIGDLFIFDSFVDEEIYPLRIKFAGTKTVKIGLGKFDCMVFHPEVQEGRIFEDDKDLTIYITNDENKIPVLAKAKVLVGSIRMELIDYKNLASPISKIK